MGCLHCRPAVANNGSEWTEVVAALHKDTVDIGLEIEGLRHTADIFEVRIAPALHVPVAASDTNANGVIYLI